MSSTKRSESSAVSRAISHDYYVTPIPEIEKFLAAFRTIAPQAFDGLIVDPCAGGDAAHPMSYPTALAHVGILRPVVTIDIREDSRADIKGDYLNLELDKVIPSSLSIKLEEFTPKPRMIITNPPFNLAEPIIKKAYQDVEGGGYVVMLQRLNFFGGKARYSAFWKDFLPKWCFVHSKRMAFLDSGQSDSIEYAHFVWQKGEQPTYTMTHVLEP